MLFEEIQIYNLFSYFGKCSFDLQGAEPQRNIALISGRNGYGKTSFIDSVKLLFGGVSVELGKTIFKTRTLNEKDYLLKKAKEIKKKLGR